MDSLSDLINGEIYRYDFDLLSHCLYIYLKKNEQNKPALYKLKLRGVKEIVHKNNMDIPWGSAILTDLSYKEKEALEIHLSINKECYISITCKDIRYKGIGS